MKLPRNVGHLDRPSLFSGAARLKGKVVASKLARLKALIQRRPDLPGGLNTAVMALEMCGRHREEELRQALLFEHRLDGSDPDVTWTEFTAYLRCDAADHTASTLAQYATEVATGVLNRIADEDVREEVRTIVDWDWFSAREDREGGWSEDGFAFLEDAIAAAKQQAPQFPEVTITLDGDRRWIVEGRKPKWTRDTALRRFIVTRHPER